ncbi:hypothetical protein [Flavobacterium sp. LS1P3]|uniref:hypothetical protein n=1 Tax=Flavobacterium sp. LS1P3 TaxID=3401720 RepID=UPI003AADBB35
MISKKKIIIYSIGFLILETLFLGLFIYNMKPDPSVSIALVLIIPFLFILNIIVATVLYFFKKEIAKLFFVNSIISPIIFYALWSLWFLDYQERNNKEYYFKIENKNFEISLSKTSDYFLISDSENIGRVYGGKYETKFDSIILVDGKIKMAIINNKLIGFPESSKEIKLSENK